MSYAIIGLGKIGTAIAQAFARQGLGKIGEGGLLVQARGRTWGQLIFQDLAKFD
jgi:hypothetical protein